MNAKQLNKLREDMKHLSKQDRAMIRMRIELGWTYKEIAEVLNIASATVRRRIHNVFKRMISKEFEMMTQKRSLVPARLRRMGEMLYLHGKSERSIVASTGYQLHEVRVMKAQLEAVCESIALR